MTPHPSPTRTAGRLAAWCGAGLLAAGLALAPLSSAQGAKPLAREPASVGVGVNQLHLGPATVDDALRCARPAHRVNFKKDRAVVAVAVGMAESYCEKKATGHNPPTSGCPHGSDDRGLWQINSCYHSEVSDHCAYRPKCNARAAKRISNHGKDWTPWSAYNNGAYKTYLSVAAQAVDRVWRHRAAGLRQ